MYLFDWLFGKKEHVQSVASAPLKAPAASELPRAAASETVAPGTAIHFHPELVGKLQQDHQALLRLYTQTQTAARRGDVVHGHGPATFAQAAQHGTAHVAGTDHAHGCARHDCMNLRDLAIDIRMPSPAPSVTMAVPP